MESSIEEPIGVRDVILSVIGRSSLALALLLSTVAPLPSDWGRAGRLAVFAIPAGLALILGLREQHRLSRFAARVEGSHPGLLRLHGMGDRVSWLAANAGQLSALTREDAIREDRVLGSEALSVSLMWRAERGVFAVVLAVFALGLGVSVLGLLFSVLGLL